MTDAYTHRQAAQLFVEDLQHLGVEFHTVDDGDRGGWSWSCSGVSNAAQVRQILAAVGRGSEELQEAFVDALFERWPPHSEGCP